MPVRMSDDNTQRTIHDYVGFFGIYAKGPKQKKIGREVKQEK